MGILTSVVSVVFVILCFLIVVVVLLQSDKSSGMGVLGGSSQSTFGSSTADIVTKITAVMVALFFIGALSLAFLEAYKAKSLREGIVGGSAAGAITQPAPEQTDAAKSSGNAGTEQNNETKK
jgi:preprotein translocase subunit SecG